MLTLTATDLETTFDDAVNDARLKGDADLVAKRQLLREFFCNREFRRAMADEVARINGLVR